MSVPPLHPSVYCLARELTVNLRVRAAMQFESLEKVKISCLESSCIIAHFAVATAFNCTQ